MTVVWLRPPNCRPMAGSVSPVCSRARYMATWRGQATRALRPLDRSSSRESEKASQVSSWTRSTVRRGGRPARRGTGRRAPRRRARRRSARPVSEWKATTRMSAPSSARALVVMRCAIACSAPSSASCDAVVLDALAQDRQARREVGRRELGDEAGLEALEQAGLERGHVGGQAVAREDELAAGLVQRVEGVEELLLGLRLALQELDVVDEQDVGVAEARLEVVDVAGLQRRDELVREALGGRAAHAQAAAVVADVVADRVQQVGLAEAGRPVEEERVVGLAGQLGDGERGGVGEAVGVADDELVERELGMKLALVAGRRRRRRRAAGERGGDRRVGRDDVDVGARARGPRRRTSAARGRSDRRPSCGSRRAPRRRACRRRAREPSAARARSRRSNPVRRCAARSGSPPSHGRAAGSGQASSTPSEWVRRGRRRARRESPGGGEYTSGRTACRGPRGGRRVQPARRGKNVRRAARRGVR